MFYCCLLINLLISIAYIGELACLNFKMSSSGQHSTAASTQATRQKTDLAWDHVRLGVDPKDGKKTYSCMYFPKTVKGGGINRMKQHLAGKKGGGSGNRRGAAMTNKGKGKAHGGIGNYFSPRTTPGAQPSIKSVLANKEAVHRADMAIARWVYDTCIPINAVNSIYYQPMWDAVLAIGPGYKALTYHVIRIPLLRDAKKEVQLFIDSCRSTWADSGCTIMADGWSDGRHRTLINFLVYCPRGITFLKSVDAFDIVKEAPTLFKLFQEIVEWVGPSNVVHMVTDNAANYIAAGRMLNEAYKNINWSPCACHCINLMLGDIAKMEHVCDLAKRASKVTQFVYNHIYLLSLLRKKPDWTEIVRLGATCFATTFIALHSMYEHMHDLQALVTCREFVESRYARDKKGKNAVAIILDKKFWNDCLVIVKIVEPLIRILRIADSDEKLAIGYIYEGMYRARLGIKKMFLHKKRLYKPYTKILKDCWDRQLRQSIHAAAYWLNPTF
ncbi:hypothetical protein L1049_002127 [Liquidambar formosana]|uniref:DUF659 domain-containing protein n=1 Tax=Liquidambar formosana TaxID=63359 RepID=A0AAP0NIT1_LIQFO